jgi:hypothetical protein
MLLLYLQRNLRFDAKYLYTINKKNKKGALCAPFLLAILIIKIGFLKTRRRRVFKKPILVFPVPKALETWELPIFCSWLRHLF